VVARALGIVQVEAVRDLDRAALPRRTRSATAAHHRDRVGARRAKDSRAVAETTPAPAATEVAAAWVAAVTAAAAAAVVVAAVG